MNEANPSGIANRLIGGINADNAGTANRAIGGIDADNAGSANLVSDSLQNANQVIGDPDAGPSYWYSRGYLPHLESPEKIQHVTFHLADSLPKTVLDQWAAELKRLPPDKQAVEQRQRVQAYLDAGHGSCVLRETEIAAMVQNSLLYFA